MTESNSTAEFSALISRFRFTPPSTPPSSFRTRSQTTPTASSSSPPTPKKAPKRVLSSRPKPILTTRDGASPYFPSTSSSEGETVVKEEEEEALEESPKKKRKKPARGYADPTVYAHLNGLSDILPEGKELDLVLVGINPGVESARRGHHYANPTNHFWKCLHGAGFTERKLDPSEGYLLAENYRIGSTNLVPRPSAEASELSSSEMTACVPNLLRKIFLARPRFVAFVGMGICEVVAKYLRAVEDELVSSPVTIGGMEVKVKQEEGQTPTKKGSPKGKKRKKALKIECGLQPFTISLPPLLGAVDESRHTVHFYALPSTSARVVAYQVNDKIKIWQDLKSTMENHLAGTPTPLPENTISYTSESLLEYFDIDKSAKSSTSDIMTVAEEEFKVDVLKEERGG